MGIPALLERSDQGHGSAVRAWITVIREHRFLKTTPQVLLECSNAVARKLYRGRVAELHREFRADGTLVTPTEADIDAAWDAYERGEAGKAGIVDHFSFIVN